MPAQAPNSLLPRKKPNILWWVLGIFFVLLVLFVLQIFGPNPRIIISPQTTHIAGPLTPDGLPDYERYYRERATDGVTPENNAATLLWPALWPGELQPSQYAAVAAELGLAKVPSVADALVRVHHKSVQNNIADWLREQDAARAAARSDADPAAKKPLSTSDNYGVDPYFELAMPLIDQAIGRPWKTDDIPPLAKWVADNQKPLDTLVEATRRPRFYMPSPSLIDNERGMMIAVLLPGIQSCREVARGLPARAMWHLGEGRPMDAWEDLHAVHRLSRLISQDGQTVVEQLVAIAISGVACESTHTLLHHGNLTPEQARKIQQDLAALGSFGNMARSIGQWERIMGLDSIVHISRSGGNALNDMIGHDTGPMVQSLRVVSIDWNLVLREANRRYDQLAEAAIAPTWLERQAALAAVDAELNRLSSSLQSPQRWLGAALTREQRSRLVADVTMALLLPAINAAHAAQDRGNINLAVVQLAAALAVYRAENGSYPEMLDALVPAVLPALPVDLFHGKPYIYRRDGEGYLLYSVGANGADDGGSSQRQRVYDGRSTDDMTDAERDQILPQIPNGSDDHAIRVPRRMFELPKTPISQ